MSGQPPANQPRIRLDKWLWAARFYKTRSLAKTAIEGGKVRVNGQRAKPAKEIEVGAELCVRQGWEEKILIVAALSDQRRGAPEAALLYRETDASRARREQLAAERRANRDAVQLPEQRPSKKQRRQIVRFRDLNFLE
ncbi:MAG TPA: S4 domain-containing protein [Porticoccaceae bacterium]|nr:S4 domain-containing protein [Porticoccaceae bacterium]